MNVIKLILFNKLAWLFSLIVLFFCCFCSGDEKINKTSIAVRQDHNKSKPPSSFSDTIKIDFPVAVFYIPDSLQLEKIKSITDTVIFESLAHDCFYQMKYSCVAISKDWPNIKIIEIRNARFLFFSSKVGSEEYIDLDTKNDPCGVLLFDGYKKAKLVDMTNIETELGNYFKK